MHRENKESMNDQGEIKFGRESKEEYIKSLIVHIVSNYREILETFDYVDIFESLIKRYEQYQDNYVPSDDTTNNITSPTKKINDWGTIDKNEEIYFGDNNGDDENPLIETEKNTEISMNDKSEKSNPGISLANPINRPSRGRIANRKAIKERFNTTQPLASGLVDYTDDDEDDIIDECILEEDEDEDIDNDDDEMMPKLSMIPDIDTKKESSSILFTKDNKTKQEEENSKENTTESTTTTATTNKYSLPNNKIRKIEFVASDKNDKMEKDEEEEEEQKEQGKEQGKEKEKKQSDLSSPTKINYNNKLNQKDDKEMTNVNSLINKNNKRSREEEEEGENTNNDDEPLPIRKKVNKEDDDEIFLQSINRNKMKKEANKLNPNNKSPLNKKIILNISPKLKHTDITSTVNSTSTSTSTSSSSTSPSPSVTHTSTSPIKKLDSNSMDEDEKESNGLTEEEYTTESIMIAKFIMDGLQSQIGSESKSRGIKAEEWFVVKNALMPSVLIELGFVSNEAEAKKLNDDKYLKKATLGIYNGITAYITHFERSRGFTVANEN